MSCRRDCSFPSAEGLQHVRDHEESKNTNHKLLIEVSAFIVVIKYVPLTDVEHTANKNIMMR